MSEEAKVGDLVVFSNGDLRGKSGVVCRPIGITQQGQVLVLNDGLITGFTSRPMRWSWQTSQATGLPSLPIRSSNWAVTSSNNACWSA